MHGKNAHWVLPLAIAGVLMAPTRQLAAEVSFRGLAPFDGLLSSKAEAVSNSGIVAGSSYSNTSGSQRATRWAPSGAASNMGVPYGVFSYASGISADGSVTAGSSGNSYYDGYGTRWSADGSVQPLNPLPGMSASHAYGVSADGSVTVGTMTVTGDWPERAVRWTE